MTIRLFSFLAGILLIACQALAQEWIAPSPGNKAATPSWIWAAPAGKDGAPGRAWFSKSFDVPAGANSAELIVAVDNIATIFLNGQEVAKVSGWSRAQRVKINLIEGKNTITVAAENRDPAGKTTAATSATNPAGFIVALRATLPDQSTFEVLSDRTWLASDSAWAGFPNGPANPSSVSATLLGDASAAPWHMSASTFQPLGPCPLLRRDFELKDKPLSATVRVIGLGHYQLRANGRAVGNDMINQAWSQYDKRLYWQEFNIAPLVKAGQNTFAAMLGDSFWRVGPANDSGRFVKTDAMPDFSNGQPYLLWLRARFTFADGSEQIIDSDSNWKWAPGPVTFSNVYAGEDYDARLLPEDWDLPTFDPGTWKPVVSVPASAAELSRLPSPGMSFIRQEEATCIGNPAPGVSVYSTAQNESYIIRLTVQGSRGSRVRMKPCEYLDPSGRVKFTYTWGTGKDIWQDYTLRGGDIETYMSPFFYIGCQYVEVIGAVPDGQPNPDGLPVIKSVQLHQVRIGCSAAGGFWCSDNLQNSAHKLIDHSIQSNMSFVSTDCPHREKNGWQEQNWHMARAMSYAYDTRAWMAKTCQDIRDAQGADGFIPTNCPWYLVGRPRHDMYNDAPEWGIAGVLVPWHLYEWYGDKETLRRSFASMKRYVDYLGTTAKNGIISSNLGDWYDYGHGKGDGPSRWTPNEVSATAIWALGAKVAFQAAAVLGENDDAIQYERLHQQIAKDFRAAFWDEATKTVKNGGSCQAGNAAAWCIGLIPEEHREAALDAVVKDLESRGWQQTTGEVLHIFLIRALAEGGRGDVLHRVYSRTERGSYGFMVKSGLTSLPESWDAKPGTGNSMNHLMLGQLMEWHYAYVGGIRQAPESVGWRRVLIAPQPGPTLTGATTTIRSPAGPIACSWERTNGEFHLETEIPEGVEADVILPDGSKRTVKAGMWTYQCKEK